MELASLSSKSDSTFVDDRVQGTLLASVFLCPVAVPAVGKLLGGSFFPVGELSQIELFLFLFVE